MNCHWREAIEWKNENLSLTTPSDQACKLFDAALTQYVGWYEDKNLGGLSKTLQSMKNSDSKFVMGHVLSIGLDLIGTGCSLRQDRELQLQLKHLENLAESQVDLLSFRELQHVKAIQYWAHGNMDTAVMVWEDILLVNPNDMLAIKFAHDTYFYLGWQQQMRDSIARIVPYWSSDTPLYSYLFGMHAFGLVETNFHRKAEQIAKVGLEMNRRDAWAIHALAHVFEMEGRTDEGISFLSTTLTDWEPCGLLSCHNFWHWALYHIEKGEFDAAIDIFDNQIANKVTSGAMLDIVDATSLLYRLELEGAEVQNRWDEVLEICLPHLNDHILAFNDVHLLMSYLGAQRKEITSKFMNSLEEFIRSGFGTNHAVTSQIGYKICEALVDFSEGRFHSAVDTLYPLRYDLFKIGGSNAQRDIFNLILIISAIKSPQKKHHCLARQLLLEKEALKGKSPMLDRLKIKAGSLDDINLK